ncbi:hypothetical protein [Murimonas intestini]|uniref:hypothetical protein n=1 Tax=Murimonas intestini TaxID=1337051 RepID=UPI0011DD2E77|nr:hypothetical protein [Murimonas intestini]
MGDILSSRKQYLYKFLNKNIVYIIFLFYLFIFTGLVVKVGGLSVLHGILFFMFQIFAITIPGIGGVLFIYKERLSSLELLILGYASGYILNILIYFMFVPLHAGKFAIVGFIALNILSCFQIKRNYSNIVIETKYKEVIIWGIALAIILFLVFILYFGNNILPLTLKENAYYTDLLYWSGDTIELSHNFPPQHFREYTQPYYYHYFSSIQLAIEHLVTEISVIELNLNFSCFQSVMLLVSSAFIFFKEIVTSKKNLYIIVGLVVLLLTTGNELGTQMNYVAHIYKSPFGFDISLAYGMFSFLFIIKQLKKKQFCFCYYIFCMLCYGICLGSKGPNGIIVLIGLGIVCLNWFFVKKSYKKGLAYGLSLIFVFAFLYFTIIVSGRTSVASSLEITNFSGSIVSNEFLSGFYNKALDAGIPYILARGLQAVFFAFHSHQTIMIIFLVGLILKIINYKSIDILDISFVIMLCCGCVLTLVLNHPSYSQMYFMLATYPFTLLFGIKSFSEFKSSNINEKLKKRLSALQVLICFIAILFGMNNFLQCYYFKTGFEVGISNLNHDSSTVLEISKESAMYNYVSQADYEAYQWIRDNTNYEDVLTSNLCLDATIQRPYCLGAFSERHVLMNDKLLIQNLMNNDYAAIEEIRVGSDIDYIVQYKRISPQFNGDELGLECVYENTSLAVFRI